MHTFEVWTDKLWEKARTKLLFQKVASINWPISEQEVRVLVIDLKIVKERLTQMLFQEAANGSVL